MMSRVGLGIAHDRTTQRVCSFPAQLLRTCVAVRLSSSRSEGSNDVEDEEKGCARSSPTMATGKNEKACEAEANKMMPRSLNSKSRPMLSPKRRETLGKMYSLVGSHSAVKLCRWQKSMMRGQGGCYKWTLYGIASHRCMEATPNMSCANKCVFCWRLNSNPTATEWKFDIDDPVEIVNGMLKSHQALVKNAKGMPGVNESRFTEAMQPRHCALSLVGEPITYPRINEFLHKLHQEKISTFLVNNGQFPEAIPSVRPVTQLYLSIDAPTKEKMRELDRPVFPDFWERFQRSVGYLAERQERTVFRVTMIEGYNMSEADVEHLVRLIDKGKPHLVELKQLTPAFQGRKTFLRMHNVPTWERMISFARALVSTAPEYDIACGHEHSSCILLARKDLYFQNEQWRTWIDFEAFHKLAVTGSGVPFPSIHAKDYALPTPSWALHGATEGGFDPQQSRKLSAKRKARMTANVAERQARAETRDEGGRG